jgi:hypothetical protein
MTTYFAMLIWAEPRPVSTVQDDQGSTLDYSFLYVQVSVMPLPSHYTQLVTVTMMSCDCFLLLLGPHSYASQRLAVTLKSSSAEIAASDTAAPEDRSPTAPSLKQVRQAPSTIPRKYVVEAYGWLRKYAPYLPSATN